MREPWHRLGWCHRPPWPCPRGPLPARGAINRAARGWRPAARRGVRGLQLGPPPVTAVPAVRPAWGPQPEAPPAGPTPRRPAPAQAPQMPTETHEKRFFQCCLCTFETPFLNQTQLLPAPPCAQSFVSLGASRSRWGLILRAKQNSNMRDVFSIAVLG